jgi:two-component system nitrogen regulation response regulator GlnG
MPTLLVVDDEASVRYSLERGLGSADLSVRSVGTAQEGIEAVARHRPDAVILDVWLPDLSGLEAFDRIRAIDPRLPVIVITAHGSTETAIETMKRGAFEYLLKPVDLLELRDLVQKAIEVSRLRQVPAVFEEEPAESADRIIGHSPAMQQVAKMVGRIAAQDVPVLLCGDSGTGKELVARAIYHHSLRRQQPYVAINCAAIPENLLESELFGHEKGAFTGADKRRIGKFEQAHRGTIFLDEVGDMSPATQAKVLRVLQDQTFHRVGGEEAIQTDVRIIAATNKDLPQLVATGAFRYDLFYRLNTFTIVLPLLRERGEDLALLTEYFLKRFGPQLGKEARAIAPDALELLQRHPWPGNIRELQNVLKYALVHSTGELVTADSLPESIRLGSRPVPTTPQPAGGLDVTELVRSLLYAGHVDIYRTVTTAVDRVVLGEVLRHATGNQVQASDLLGISRTTLRAKLRALGMLIEKSFPPGSDSGASP